MTVTAASGALPSDPKNLTGVAKNGQVALSWTASTGATAYNVYRGTVFDGEATTPIATVTSPSYTDTGVTTEHCTSTKSPRPTASAFQGIRIRSR